MQPVRLLSHDAQESPLTFKRPSYLGSARGETRDEPGPGGLAGRRASGRDPGAAPVPSPLARHSRGEALR